MVVIVINLHVKKYNEIRKFRKIRLLM